MSITVILEADVKPGRKKELLESLMKYLPDTIKYKGFINISIHSEADTETIIFLSQWQSIKAYQEYLQWRTDTGVMGLLSDLLMSVPKIRFLNNEISNELAWVGD